MVFVAVLYMEGEKKLLPYRWEIFFAIFEKPF